MGELVVILVVFFLVLVIKAASGGSPTTYAGICKRGVPARGILLSVSPVSSGAVGVAPYRYQKRDVVMDIEIPGRPPYEASVQPLVPTNLVRDILPGATVELRVDPRYPTRIAIVGPGVGFNAALLNAGASAQGGS